MASTFFVPGLIPDADTFVAEKCEVTDTKKTLPLVDGYDSIVAVVGGPSRGSGRVHLRFSKHNNIIRYVSYALVFF